MVDSIIQLKPHCNNYPWGKLGSDSLSARLCSKTPGTDFKVENDKPYAEMWMGTYPSLPARVLSSNELLQDVVDANPKQLVGEKVMNKFGHSKISFIPKVLSIAKALPLQVHPNIELAKKLHAEKPDQFTDPNHKPEIALALSHFEAFVGFKPLEDVKSLLKLDPLQRFLPEAASSANFTNEDLKRLTYNILTASDEDIAAAQTELMLLNETSYPSNQKYVRQLLARIQKQYPATDPGTLVALVCMNYESIEAGECLYVPADGIHAWFQGDIIECMARSDNVLNTGFCPRADRDSAELFTKTLTFDPHDPKSARCRPQQYSGSRTNRTKVYAPPTSEFNVLRTTLKDGESDTIKAIEGPSIMWNTGGDATLKDGQGKAYDLNEGYVYFIGPGIETTIEHKKGDLVVYRGYAE